MVQILDFEKEIFSIESQIKELTSLSNMYDSVGDITHEIAKLKKKLRHIKHDVFGNLNGWQKTQVARHSNRPYTLDYINFIFKDFFELHGDRHGHDGPAIVAGLAKFDSWPVMVIGNQKGRDTQEKIKRNFGMSHPGGYRKALRLMKLAEKFGLPIVTLIDTPGAYPGVDAEEKGQRDHRQCCRGQDQVVVVVGDHRGLTGDFLVKRQEPSQAVDGPPRPAACQLLVDRCD